MDDNTAQQLIEKLDEAYKNNRSRWEEFSDIPIEAVGIDPIVGLYASPKLVRDLMKEKGKTNKEICSVLGVRHTDDVPHPVEHLRFGKRRRSHKINRLT